jgi:hypothetical protein
MDVILKPIVRFSILQVRHIHNGVRVPNDLEHLLALFDSGDQSLMGLLKLDNKPVEEVPAQRGTRKIHIVRVGRN